MTDTTPVVGDEWEFPDFTIRITSVDETAVEYAFAHNQKARVLVYAQQWHDWLRNAKARKVT